MTTKPKSVLELPTWQIEAVKLGRKTQHRVPVVPQPEPNELLKVTKDALTDPKLADELFDAMVRHDLPLDSPFGAPGFVLTLGDGVQVMVERVWCERIQEVSEGDCIAEGVLNPPVHDKCGCSDRKHLIPTVAHCAMWNRWDDLHGPGAWDRNEYVFACEWKLID